jgi:glutathione synthase/RimK-type ligase-like ATP-grasp enzyme
MRQYQMAIVSLENDLHALIIQKAIEKHNDLKCHIIQSDRICASAGLSWTNTVGGNVESRIYDRDGQALRISTLDVIWWRRAGFPQKIPSDIVDPIHLDVIENDCRTALFGLLLNEFRGTWVNHPINTALAENKLIQLRAAQQAGFRVPRTLVSQDPSSIRRFCEELDYKVVVKSVRGTRKTQLYTSMITPAHLEHEDSIMLCPATYQEYIPGDLHLRVQAFGNAVYSASIESQDLDWRSNLDVPFTGTELTENVKQRLHDVLKSLGLKMGVVDLKLTPKGEPIWLEINPQGQFLFVEGLCGLELMSAFAEFLYHEARESANRS